MTEIDHENLSQQDLVTMTVDIVAAYVSNKSVDPDQLPEVINTVFTSLSSLNSPKDVEENAPLKPAVSIKRSITPDYIVCLEDGKKLKMLKRHLRTAYGLTPDDYRTKWGLPSDYPMVAPNYAQRRSHFAKQIGLGKKRVA
ncbi:MAG: MucR family transcriptional regulator [Rhodospirillaceae bacterium]